MGTHATVVDLCSGKGFFSLVLALEYPRLRVIAVDSNAAIKTGHFGLLPNLSFLRADITSAAFAADLDAALRGDDQRTDPNATLGLAGSKAPAERQPSTMADRQLLGAAEMGDHDVLVQALEDGARLDAVDDRAHTALHWAARWGRVVDVKALVAAGAPLNAKTKAGVTPLIYAASDGWDECVPVLLEAGADHTVATSKGRTALQVVLSKVASADDAKKPTQAASQALAIPGLKSMLPRICIAVDCLQNVSVMGYGSATQTVQAWEAGDEAALSALEMHSGRGHLRHE